MRVKICILFVFFSVTCWSQTNRYFVFFKDKANSPFTVGNPSTFLSAQSIARRQKQNISVVEEDLPVNTIYVQQVKATGAKTFFTSKWWNGVLVQTDAATISTINALPFVSKTELVAPNAKLLGGRVASKEKEESTLQTTSTNATEFQLGQIALDKMQALGYRGENINIAQFDSGWIGVNTASPFQHLFADGRIKSTFNFVTNTSNVYSTDDHGTEVFSVMAGYVPNTFVGGVYKANFFLYLTEDVSTEYRIEEYNWAFAAEKADSAGVDVINSSLGYNTFDQTSMDYAYADMNGSKTVVSIAAKKATEKGMIVVCSAGNEGARSWKYITAPADVNGVLAIGSVTTTGSRSSFSSFGPSADNRIKPDVVAFGSGTVVVTPTGSIGTASGTSLASPLVACLVAGLVQAYPSLKSQEIREAIIKSGDQSFAPDNNKGYGIPSFEGAVNSLKTIRQTDYLAVYPNPVSSSTNYQLTISFKEPIGDASIVLYDLLGRVVFSYTDAITWSKIPLALDFSNQPTGVYILEIKSSKGNYTTKVVKSN